MAVGYRVCMDGTELGDPDALLPGDVVVDDATHRPLQIVGRDPRRASQVADVWNSDLNHEVYEVDETTQLYACVYLPQGGRLTVPKHVHVFPAPRLTRVPVEYPPDSERPQRALVRNVCARLVAGIDADGYETVGQAVVAKLRAFYTSDYVDSIRDLANAVAAERGGDE